MAPTYRVVYFDARARAECIRVLLHLADVPFTDERVAPPDWAAMKTSGRCPFGELPLLEISDGRKLAQSHAIFRFLAKEHGLAPSDSYSQARCDMFLDNTKDMIEKVGTAFWEKDEKLKEQKSKEFHEETLPKRLEFINKLFQENKGGKGYLVGDKITYADIDFFCFFNGFINSGKLDVPEQLSKYPLLVDLYNRVMNEKKILEYLKQRKPNPDWYPF
ncbi:predicted protein [Nematostella vectensis]|uniref:Glutathione transferase n=1 Tax=Nematostella vectensis TaxID=45351 RepID=A7SR87_NEMVE|nr:probable glutathione S-transferase gst-36 [Nematostella vectensis]EDO33767.1 predicted protein [Nematostella vectensis]|eukprot:XP_001625867.1 predicted protein [Nematostella vectensis]